MDHFHLVEFRIWKPRCSGGARWLSENSFKLTKSLSTYFLTPRDREMIPVIISGGTRWLAIGVRWVAVRKSRCCNWIARTAVKPTMSIYIRQNNYVTIHKLERENSPRPLPLASGFSEGLTYEILGINTPSESSEAFLILKNDLDEMWFISDRHVRIVGLPIQRPANVNGHLRLQEAL